MNKNNNIVIYQSEDGKVHLDVVYNEETMWLSQQQLCELYQTSKSNVSEHIKHIFEDGELDKEVVVRNFRITTRHGAIEGKMQSRDVTHYNNLIIFFLQQVNSCCREQGKSVIQKLCLRQKTNIANTNYAPSRQWNKPIWTPLSN